VLTADGLGVGEGVAVEIGRFSLGFERAEGIGRFVADCTGSLCVTVNGGWTYLGSLSTSLDDAVLSDITAILFTAEREFFIYLCRVVS